MASFFPGASNVVLNHANFKVDIQRDSLVQRHRELAEWISPINFRRIQADTIKKRTLGTGEWLLRSDEFARWFQDDQGVLWLTGMPGVGKTILASIIIDYLQASFPAEDRRAVVFAYFRYTDTCSSEEIFAAFVRQLVELLPVLPTFIEEVYKDHKRRGIRLSEEGLEVLFHHLIRLFSKVVVVIDALDEASDDCRISLIESLAPFPVCQLMTSRPLDMGPILTHKIVRIQIETETERDIELFIIRSMESNHRLQRVLENDQALYHSILFKVKEKANGMFLAANLHMKSLSKCNTKDALRIASASLPTDLYNIYRTTLERIRSQGNEDASVAIRALLWTTYSHRPLTSNELRHASAISPTDKGFSEDKTTPIELIIEFCFGLLVLDEEGDRIRLAHYTVDDFLRSLDLELFSKPHTFMTATCIAYLMAFNIHEASVETPGAAMSFLRRGVFLSYACNYWGYHARSCYAEGGLPRCIPLFLESIPRYPLLIHDISYYRRQDVPYLKTVENLSPCHTATYYGLHDILEYLGDPHSPTTSRNRTTLMLATDQGHTEIVKLLLATARASDVNRVDGKGNTALHIALLRGQHDIACLLLDHDAVDVNATRESDGATALHLTLGIDHEGVSKKLIANPRVDVNVKNMYGQTALHMASASKSKGTTISLLLISHHAIDIHSRTKDGLTALHIASQDGHTAVVEKLLAVSHIDVNARDNDGRTALHRAANYRSGKDAVPLLLAHKLIDVNATSEDGRTALHVASGNIHEDSIYVLRLLLSHGAHVNVKDRKGQTALDKVLENPSCGEAISRELHAHGGHSSQREDFFANP